MTHGPSIAIVTGSLSSNAGGLYQSVRLPANRMAARGVPISVHGLKDNRWEAAGPTWNVPRLFAYDILGPARFGYAPEMAVGLADDGPDITHLHGIWGYPSYAAWRWRRRTSKPLIIAPRGMLDPWALANSALKKRLVARLFEHDNLGTADVLHALCRSEAASMRAFGLRNAIAIIPNGVDLPPAEALTAAPVDGVKTLLFLGRIHPKKGLSELLDAWHIAASGLSGWRLDIAGWDDGGHERALRAQAERLDIVGSVRFVGPLHGAEKEAALREAVAFVLPSHSEGLPMAVLEAWAWGKAVFMTDACNLPEGFAAGAAVRITTEPEKMASVLSRWLPAAGDLSAVGRNGRALAEVSFTWDAVVDRQLQLYAWLAGGNQRPDFVEGPVDG
jgi:poly(glycerol-phosphate) alpha-glucosyltransferase